MRKEEKSALDWKKEQEEYIKMALVFLGLAFFNLAVKPEKWLYTLEFFCCGLCVIMYFYCGYRAGQVQYR